MQRNPGKEALQNPLPAFNRSVRSWSNQDLLIRADSSKKLETAHSLAYKILFSNTIIKSRAQGYKTSEIAELLNLQGNQEKHTEYISLETILINSLLISATVINKKWDLNYLDVVSDNKTKSICNQLLFLHRGQAKA